MHNPKLEFLPDEVFAGDRVRVTAPSWYERLRGIVIRDREPASRSYRYMSRLIEREYATDGVGTCLGFFSPDSDRTSTHVVLMLAYCLQSELDKRVLIVDARPRKSTAGVTGRLGLVGARGFSDVLREEPATALDAVQPTAVPNVEVLPAGCQGDGGDQPLVVDREGLRRLFEEARSRYGHVLVQTGSVLADTRNLLVASQVDVVFLLAEENRTLMKSVDDCRQLLLGNGVARVRVVVTGGAL